MKQFLFMLFLLPTSLLTQTFKANSPNDKNYYSYTVNSDGNTVTLIDSKGDYKKYKTIHVPSKVSFAGKEYRVTTIAKFAFYNCEKVREAVISEGIETIGQSCFWDCKNLEVVHLPSSLRTLSYCLFQGCSKLRNVFIGLGSLQSIEDFVFDKCVSLNSIAIPSTVTQIGSSIFRDCESIQRIIVDGANEHFKAIDGVLFTADGKELLSYPSGNKRSDYIIPDGVEIIGNSAFQNTKHLERVYFPVSLKKIEHIGFRGCSSISEITLGDQVTWIGNGAFWDCTKLEVVTMNRKTQYTIEKRPEDSYNTFMPKVQLYKLEHVNLNNPVAQVSTTVFAVKDFMMVANDISARVNEVKDSNNESCALIKLQVEDDLISVEGNFVKIDKQESLEKWIYITEGTKHIKFVFKKHLPITLSVTDYGLEELKGKSTYILRIE